MIQEACCTSCASRALLHQRNSTKTFFIAGRNEIKHERLKMDFWKNQGVF